MTKTIKNTLPVSIDNSPLLTDPCYFSLLKDTHDGSFCHMKKLHFRKFAEIWKCSKKKVLARATQSLCQRNNLAGGQNGPHGPKIGWWDIIMDCSKQTNKKNLATLVGFWSWIFVSFIFLRQVISNDQDHRKRWMFVSFIFKATN